MSMQPDPANGSGEEAVSMAPGNPQPPDGRKEGHMARAKVNRELDSRRTQQVISTAVDAAQALITGVGRVAERAIAETARVAEDMRAEIDAALARIKQPARKVATRAGDRAPKAVAKTGPRRRRRRPVA
jgi:hypothetical protein